MAQDSVYYEGTFVNYSFRQTPDMKTRIAKFCGGDDAFVKLLDSFFGYNPDGTVRPPVVQLPINSDGWKDPGIHAAGFASHSYEGLCNEPDMESPYSYLYAGRPDRLAEVIFAVKTYSFSPGRGGLAGNNDSGAETALFVFSSLGIFPVAGQPIYLLGVPSFNSSTLQLGAAGPSLKVTKGGSGMYVQSASFDGKPLNGQAWLKIADVHGPAPTGASGHTLSFAMGAKPGAEWGSVRPPSYAPTDPPAAPGTC
jgi:putative alpha-1,2-mannosidase